MAQRHKGDRTPLTIRPPTPLALHMAELAADAGYSNVNQFVVDALCERFDMAHLALGPDQLQKEVLPFSA